MTVRVGFEPAAVASGRMGAPGFSPSSGGTHHHSFAPRACTASGISHLSGGTPLPSFQPDPAALPYATTGEGANHIEPGTIAQRGSGIPSSERTRNLLSGTPVSGCRPGSTFPYNTAPAAHLARERGRGQEV